MTFQAMETPLVMSGFQPEAIRFWQQQTAGHASGAGGCGRDGRFLRSWYRARLPIAPKLEPGSAVSMQLVRGDLEIAATCTVTYIDPKQLLACGHPVLALGRFRCP